MSIERDNFISEIVHVRNRSKVVESGGQVRERRSLGRVLGGGQVNLGSGDDEPTSSSLSSSSEISMITRSA